MFFGQNCLIPIEGHDYEGGSVEKTVICLEEGNNKQSISFNKLLDKSNFSDIVSEEVEIYELPEAAKENP